MAQIEQLVDELLPLIQEYKEGRISGDVLEAQTSKIIISDTFEEIDTSIQHYIEQLDTWEIQEFTPAQLDTILIDLRSCDA